MKYPPSEFEGRLARKGRRRGLLIGCAALGLSVVVVTLLGFILVSMMGPDTKVISGDQVSKTSKDILRDLDLVQPGENLKFLYSDAFLDIKQGMYGLTDRKLFVYSEANDPAAIVVPIDEILKVSVTYSDSFWAHTEVWVTYGDMDSVLFPLSTEGGGDREFLRVLNELHERSAEQRAP